MDDATAGDRSWSLTDEEGGALSARWWKWALSAPRRRSPVLDRTGEHAGWKQPKDLWFLAGTYGGRVVRRCEVPTDRPVFFPVLNVQYLRQTSRKPLTLAVARAEAYLNGAPLPLREFTAKPFWAALTPRDGWGIWAGIAPLAPGQYVLEIKASTVEGFWVDTTYHLSATDR
ncbi:hypothetical protein [Streptomyces sp. GMY02]|uniref:hypothetical protein n=1 Tax=Streptomyces sp. GMY02 TaxID=1333528 RepID=UPI0020B8473F|nr:hypothetical protein [Streptomyces sp. GMY02]